MESTFLNIPDHMRRSYFFEILGENFENFCRKTFFSNLFWLLFKTFRKCCKSNLWIVWTVSNPLINFKCRLDPLVWGPPGPRTGGSNLYKTRKVMWPHLDDMWDHIRTFLSIIIIWLSTSRDGKIPWRVLYLIIKPFKAFCHPGRWYQRVDDTQERPLMLQAVLLLCPNKPSVFYRV